MPKEKSVVKKRGRSPGSLNHKTRAVLAQALKDGVTPPEAMLKNMRRWWKLALKSEATGQMQRAADFFERAQDFAVAAARYVHSRLTPVKHDKDGSKDFAVIRTVD
jgi:hypothetical protein